MVLVSVNYFFSIGVGLILWFFPILLLSLSVAILWPFEKVWDWYLKQYILKQINKVNPIVIGITGSYGKSSVKQFLYQILKCHRYALATPASFNTLRGVAQMIKWELVSKVRYLVVEMGAYKKGDIRELAQIVNPTWGILTAIGSQHLERFGSLENTTNAKFELAESVSNNQMLVNADNHWIKGQLELEKYQGIKTYSIKNPADYRVEKYILGPEGMNFTIKFRKQAWSFKTELFGTSNLYNITAAIGLSHMLGVPLSTIQRIVSRIKPAPHRLQLHRFGDNILIDNAYSSNESGFLTIISDLKGIKGKKALITPGIVELGSGFSQKIHHQIGVEAAKVFEKIVLVGRSDRTMPLKQGIVSAANSRNLSINYIDEHQSIWEEAVKLAQHYDWVLLENHLPVNYY